MTKKEITPEVQAMLATLNKRLGKNHGAGVLKALGERTKSDPSSAQFNEGDELLVGEDVANLFSQTFNGRETCGVTAVCKSAAGAMGAKALYFSALDRNIPEYGEDLQPTGEIVSARTEEVHDVYDIISGCATELEAYNAIKGKTLKVAAVNTVIGARYNSAGQVTGTRTRKIPVFTFA